jgi:hypothetical protein
MQVCTIKLLFDRLSPPGKVMLQARNSNIQHKKTCSNLAQTQINFSTLLLLSAHRFDFATFSPPSPWYFTHTIGPTPACLSAAAAFLLFFLPFFLPLPAVELLLLLLSFAAPASIALLLPLLLLLLLLLLLSSCAIMV